MSAKKETVTCIRWIVIIFMNTFKKHSSEYIYKINDVKLINYYSFLKKDDFCNFHALKFTKSILQHWDKKENHKFNVLLYEVNISHPILIGFSSVSYSRILHIHILMVFIMLFSSKWMTFLTVHRNEGGA